MTSPHPGSEIKQPDDYTRDRGLMSVHVKNQLLHYFEAHNVRPGDQILSEPDVVELFKVGRSTAREALKLLEHEGLVEVRPGRGRFLTSLAAAAVERPITRFESVTEMLRSLGYKPQTLVLFLEEGVPTEAEQHALRLTPDDAVVRVTRLRSDGEQPLVFSMSTLNRGHIPGPVKHVNWSGSLVETLRQIGKPLSFATARIEALCLPVDLQEKYSLEGHDPWLLTTETVITATGEPALYTLDYHRGDLFAFNVLRR
jgi:GntR family transcriptional regulator